MHLAKIRYGTWDETVAMIENGVVAPLVMSDQYQTLADLLEADDVRQAVESLRRRSERLPLASVTILAPIDRQEVWAAGVTYKRSKVARMEESQGAARFYDLVYEAARPELFFKASPHRVAGIGQPLRIRADAKWNVPEPELTLVLNSRMQLVAFTVGNDMSSRDIEGENPLYLPQAKVYDACCGLGPWITVADAMPPREEIGIQLTVRRGGKPAFQGETSIEQMARTFEDLIGWLGRDNSFPQGVFLLTGTGIVPKDDFTLEPGDVVEITIDGIGTLSNPVAQGKGNDQ
jgi:2-dehydro-3-deoxy-D-arabinonate dehydratase